MNYTIFIQCDFRYNNYLLKKIAKKEVIGHTIGRARQFKMPIITSIYDCDENKELINYLKSFDEINVILSNEENVTKRFYNAVIGLEGYIVRIGGDQALLNVSKTNEIIEAMNDYEFFYDENISNSVLPDIVTVELLNRKKEEIFENDRYFRPLLNDASVKRLHMKQDILLHTCRVSDYVSYVYVKNIIEGKIDVIADTWKGINRLNSRTSDLYSSGILTSWMMGDSACDFFYDINGDINPWWCEAAVNLVKDRIKNIQDVKVFEWGSGNSTLFWSKYAEKVISIEYDKVWYDKLKAIVPDNVNIKYCELQYDGCYCEKIINEQEKFDIILIDGRDRVRCAYNCLNNLSDKGVIIWDDTFRDYYKIGIDFLKEKGFKQLELSGVYWAGANGRQSTSIFYRENNIFEI